MGIYGTTWLNEVYFGKSKEMLHIEELLGKIRQPHLGEYVKFKNKSINSSKEVLAFNRAMEKFFQFGVFTLSIQNSTDVNACTMPISYNLDHNRKGRNIVADKNTFKFKPEMNYAVNCNITSGLIFNPNFTDEEVMAVILHEIGHNFQDQLNKAVAALTPTIMVVTVITNAFDRIVTVYLTNSLRSSVDTVVRDLRYQNSDVIEFMDTVLFVKDIVKNTINEAIDLARAVTGGALLLIAGIVGGISKFANPLTLIPDMMKKSVGRQEEQTADNFATMYGYGAALSSALNKMGGRAGTDAKVVMKAVDSIPIYGTLMHFVEMPGLAIISAGDEHPEGIKRCQDQIAMLKYELNNGDIDPKMKKRIESDIKDLEKALEKYTDTTEGLDDPYLAKKVYNNTINELAQKDIFKNNDMEVKKRNVAFKDYNNIYGHAFRK